MTEQQKKITLLIWHGFWITLPSGSVFFWGLFDIAPERYGVFASLYLIATVVLVHTDRLRDRLAHPTRPDPPAFDNFYMVQGLVVYLSFLAPDFLAFLKFIAG